MIRPYLEQVQDSPEEEVKDMVTNLLMALSTGVAVLGRAFLTADPKEFGDHVGTFVAKTMGETEVTDRVKIRYGREESYGKPSAKRSTTKKSLWG